MRPTYPSTEKNRCVVPVLPGLLVLSVTALTSHLSAQDLPTAKPGSVGLSSERFERMGAAMQRMRENLL